MKCGNPSAGGVPACKPDPAALTFLLCKFTSKINECSAALRSSGLYLRYGCSLLCRASVIVVIIEPLAFIIFSYPCWQKKRGHPTVIKNCWTMTACYPFYSIVKYLSRKSSLFLQSITGSSTHELQINYKIHHELEVNKLKLWITWKLKPLKRAQMFFFCF